MKQGTRFTLDLNVTLLHQMSEMVVFNGMLSLVFHRVQSARLPVGVEAHVTNKQILKKILWNTSNLCMKDGVMRL